MNGQKRMEKEMVLVKFKSVAKAQGAGHVKARGIADLYEQSVGSLNRAIVKKYLDSHQIFIRNKKLQQIKGRYKSTLASERGDVPGWVLVVLMTTGLVTAIWTIAAPRLTSILKNSLDAMNGIR